MPKEKFKTVYVCTSCGEVSSRWMGRCPSCGEWNTMEEDVVKEATGKGLSAAQSSRTSGGAAIVAKRLKDISTTEERSRIITGISELDRVLGGGIVLGSVVLLGGEPGAGKSTLLLQLCGAISEKVSVLYITGEESVRQIKLRAMRLKVHEDNIMLASETDIGAICELITQTKP
ncbi:MAG: ATPase domain-containing protein, partial [Ruthenibacterium sp.]